MDSVSPLTIGLSGPLAAIDAKSQPPSPSLSLDLDSASPRVVPTDPLDSSIDTHSFERTSAKRANSVSSDADRGRFKPRLGESIPGSDAEFEVSAASRTADPTMKAGKVFSDISLPTLRVVSSAQAIQEITSHYVADLPEVEKMFPWLHGMSNRNFAQLRFLKGRSWDDQTSDFPLNCKSLTVVRSTNEDNANSLIKGSVSPSEILLGQVGTSVDTLLSEVVPYLNPALISKEQLISDFIDTGLLPIFQDLDPPVGVSLRNFHIQVAKFGLMSDFIVYCMCPDHSTSQNKEKSSCQCSAVARLLHVAQIRQAHIAGPEQHTAFETMLIRKVDVELFRSQDLVTSLWLPPDKMDEDVDLDRKVFDDWESNYIYREKLEISKMSRATYVSSNVWFGNSCDFELFKAALTENPKSFKEKKVSPGYHNPPLHCDPENTIVTLTKKYVDAMSTKDLQARLRTTPNQRWGLCIHCGENFRFPRVAALEPLFSDQTSKEDPLYIEFPSSGSVNLGDCSDEDLSSLVNICKLLYYKCSLSASSPGLIFCFDGYTETSLLGLCFLIYVENMTVDDAIIKLHKQYGRPVFVFKSDYQFLTRVEPLLRKFSPYGKTMEEQCSNMKLETIDGPIISRALLGPSRNTVSVGNSRLNVTSFDNTVHHSTVEVGSDDSSDDGSGCCASVHGSLPSRILPHLYLGSLVHAANLDLLNELGITRVVSVGECIPWVDDLSFEVSIMPSGCEVLTVKPYQRTSSGRLCHVKQVMGIGNINDDGIGTLTTTINDALDFIEQAYSNNEKVLVHCQVGVSRSATVCIAETMKRMNISLPRAYLYVRVRRLNVIIQPNLKLMYELFKWEESFVRSKREQAERRRQSVESTYSDRSVFSEVERKQSLATSFGSLSSLTPRFRARKISEGDGKLPIQEESALMSEDEESDFGLEAMAKSETVSSLNDSRSMVTFTTGPFNPPPLGFESTKNFTKVSVVEKSAIVTPTIYDADDLPVISNHPAFLREVDWNILCREVHRLNKAYIYPSP